MKARLCQIGYTAVLLFGLLACSPQTSSTIALTSADSGKQVDVPPFAEITITLESNATTGYSWTENATVSNPALLQQTSHRYVSPGQTIPGRGGQEVWTFKTLAVGTVTISMEYKRPFEPNNPPANTFNVTVNVKPDV